MSTSNLKPANKGSNNKKEDLVKYLLKDLQLC